MDIKNAVVLVTGANRGLGLAFVNELLAAGVKKVYAAARDPSTITVQGVERVKLDVTRPEDIAAAASRCSDVTLLINNAGVSRGSPFLAAGSAAAARSELETNFFGPLVMSQAFAPVLAANGGGAIVNVLSVLSWLNLSGAATYSASKSAAWSLTNGLRNELRGQGTQVLALHVALHGHRHDQGHRRAESEPPRRGSANARGVGRRTRRSAGRRSDAPGQARSVGRAWRLPGGQPMSNDGRRRGRRSAAPCITLKGVHMSNDIVICSPVRSAIGSFGGSLKDTPASALGAHVIAATLRRSGLDPALVDSVVMGNVVQAGNGMNVARQAAIQGGLPVGAPAMTVNRVCGSGAQAVATAYAEVAAGLSRMVIAGGVENMDRAPYLLPGMRFGARMGNAEAVDSLLLDGLHDAFSTKHSGWHTEDLVQKYKLSREAQDAFAAQSQQRFAAAQAAGWFAAEIEPLTLKGKKGPVSFAADEANRPDTTIESLSKLKPGFRADGTITAGNAPGVNAGAAAMIVCDSSLARDTKLEPMLAIRGIGVAGVEPGMFGLGPLPAMRQALDRAGWKVGDVDRFEVNEAFAAIAIVVRDELKIDPARFNVDGGAIAHGHPIGATGAILITKVAHALRRTGGSKAVVSLCIGGGQGIALCLERV